ncbi:MAG: protein-L-isoaspartate(D-aspartate) O-methyltransferase [Theionarchaea archaeon]|nr:protein-L-isoaspartate(D-aspartate) O-methyltransferase [Theionarchaea archaeon]
MKIIFGILVMLLVFSGQVEDYTAKREEMVEKHIIARGITDAQTIEAMLTVPRHLFVPESLRDEAYADYPLPIGYGQTISQPYVVALMTSSLALTGDEKALEIGTGSGYQAAVLAEIVDRVYTVEIIPELAQKAETTLAGLGYTNVTVMNADGYYGWEEVQPFDVIMITAAVDHIPPPLIQQLKEGGRLILPLGNPLYYQALTLVENRDNELHTKHISDVSFVPMTGRAQGSEEIAEESEEIMGESEEVEETIFCPGAFLLGSIFVLIVFIVIRKVRRRA